MKNKIYATIFAILAAVLYAINMPCSKLLLEHIDSTMLASFLYLALAILLGFVAYGLSIFFYIKAQKYLGAAKTSAYYAIAQFVGTFLSLIIIKEAIDYSYFIGLAIMIVAYIIIVLDILTVKHCHEHVHFANLNNHPYVVRHHIEKKFDDGNKNIEENQQK